MILRIAIDIGKRNTSLLFRIEPSHAIAERIAQPLRCGGFGKIAAVGVDQEFGRSLVASSRLQSGGRWCG